MSDEPASSARDDARRVALRSSALRDIVLIVGVLMGVKAVLLRFDSLWSYAGPVSLLASVAVASWCLHRSGESWTNLGLRRPRSIPKMLGWALLALIVTIIVGIVVEGVVTAAVGSTTVTDPRYAGRFDDVPGNGIAYLYWLAVSWIVGGFAEEMLFRAMLISRFERVLGAMPWAIIMAIVLQAMLFGQQHYYYQGLNGALATGAIALISGAIYVALRRNLWPLILSHGVANSIGLTLLFAGVAPQG